MASRVLGLAVSQVAASATALVGEAMLKPGDTELEAAHRYLDATRTLQPMLGPAVVYYISPFDLLPEALLGPIGYLDDLVFAVYVLNRLLSDTDVRLGCT